MKCSQGYEDRCINSEGNECYCECGGVNHGKVHSESSIVHELKNTPDTIKKAKVIVKGIASETNNFDDFVTRVTRSTELKTLVSPHFIRAFIQEQASNLD